MKLFAVTTIYVEGDSRIVTYESHTVTAVFAKDKDEAKAKTKKSTRDNVYEIKEIDRNAPLEKILLNFGIGFIK